MITRMPPHRIAVAPLSCGAALAALLVAGPAAAAAPVGLWPCIQPKVATLASGQMWAGPPIENLDWHADADVAELVPVLAARRTSIEDATQHIESFAQDAGADRNAKLTLLFAGTFEQINALRSRIMEGIERYSQHQLDLSQRIKQESLDLAHKKKAADTAADKAQVAQLEQQVLWDTRIYDTRAQAMTAVCESPVILDQRAFAIARAIQNVMQ
ncbi:hypothetical protein MKI84_14875 [Ancylobacter sp. A5.8]|uniref:hypothetical protein n=1 Tax=Ancylobacter gelatini TaxID=2919920 RepID=UPI001F4D5FDC|nr:hypothetical protein [Ancylobacter gelatini]MCJ8144203.1 hypothetical protein [Ancylobacter gelatini]